MNIIDSNSLCGFKKNDDEGLKKDALTEQNNETEMPEILDDNDIELSLLDTLAHISDTIYDDIEENDNVVAIAAEKKYREIQDTKQRLAALKAEEAKQAKDNVVVPLEKKKPTISHVKLQILSKQNLNSNPARELDQDKVISLLDRLSKASKGQTKNSSYNKAFKVLTAYCLPVVMLVSGASILVNLYTDYQSETVSNQAVELYKAGEFKKANALFSQALNLNQDNATAHVHLGLLGKDKKESYKHYSEALKSNPNNSKTLKLAGKLALELELYNDAVNHYNKLLKVSSSNQTVENLSNRAFANAKLRNWEDALTDYQKVLELAPNNQTAIIGTAFCCKNKNEVKAAQILLNDLLSKSPNIVEARVLNGWCLKDQKRFDEAYNDLAWVAENAPENVEGNLYFAQLLDETGDVQRAKEQLSLVLKLDPDNYHANLLKASHLLKDGNHKEALAKYKELDSHPHKVENYNTLLNVSEAAIKSNDNNTALVSLSKIIALKPDNNEAYLDRAKVHAQKRLFRKAINDASEAINIKPDHANAYVARAGYHQSAGNKISSMNDYHKALKLDPHSVEANLAVANHHSENNQYASAMDFYKKVLAVDPSNEIANQGILVSNKTLKAMVGKRAFNNKSKLSKKQLKELETLPHKELVAKGYEAMQTGKFTYATKAFNRAVSLKPRSIQARRYLAHTYLAMGNPKYAEAQLCGLRALGADKQSDGIQLAKSFLQNGLVNRAISVLERHTDEYPLDLEALTLLTNSYSANGNTDKAIALCDAKLKVAKTNAQKMKLNRMIASLKKTLQNDVLMEDTNVERSSVPIEVRG